MPLYRYIALDKSGKKISATLDANSKQHLKDVVKAQGLLIASCELANQQSSESTWEWLMTSNPSKQEVFLFSRQLSVLLNAKLPLMKSIELLIEQFSDSFNRILIKIKDDLREGSSFAAALEKYPNTFQTFYVQLVKAGELSGNLEYVLEKLTAYLAREIESAEKISGAFAYPIFILILTILIVIGALKYVVPQFAQMFAQLGGELPGPTQLLVSLSDFFNEYWQVGTISIVIITIIFLWWKNTKAGSYQLDSLLLKMPVISKFSRTKAVTQFSRTLGTLLDSNAGLPESLSIVCNIIENQVLVQTLQTARENIIKEGKIAKYLSETNIFPPIAIYMIQTGEESGDLAKMLITVGNDYEKEFNNMTDSIIKLIDPVMMGLIGVIVLWMTMAIILPALSMGDLIKT
jgi:type II secretory pathway component PulF